MSRLRLRTPKAIDAASRWTPAPVTGWKYWLATALVLLGAWLLPERWAFVASVVLLLGLWFRDRFLACPDLDQEAPRDGTRGTLTSSER